MLSVLRIIPILRRPSPLTLIYGAVTLPHAVLTKRRSSGVLSAHDRRAACPDRTCAGLRLAWRGIARRLRLRAASSWPAGDGRTEDPARHAQLLGRHGHRPHARLGRPIARRQA